MSELERDLGMIMHKIAKPSRQCAEAAKKTNSTLGLIRTIVTREKDTIPNFYKSLISPSLEYCIQHWRRFVKNIVREGQTKILMGKRW